jgi:arylsulfatase A-like enzyme
LSPSHTAASEKAQGISLGGDVVLQLDRCVGQVLDVLDRLGLAEKTLVIFTSDNGPVIGGDSLRSPITSHPLPLDNAADLCG